MAITSGFFDSVNGDRLYDAEQMSNYFDGIVSNGVYENVGDRFLVSSANDGMKVSVGSGRAIINCRWVKNDEAVILTLDPSDVALNRIDAIVLRLDTSSRSIELAVKKGTAVSGNPALPAITRNDLVYELYIASVLVRKGATLPTTITDLRPSSYCGWVTGVIKQVDTADLFTQWQEAYSSQFSAFAAFIAQKEAAFNEWFENLTQTLIVDSSVEKYERVQVIDHTQIAGQIFDIDIPEYDRENDLLFVYVNGVYFAEDKDESSSVTDKPYGRYIFESNTAVSLNKTLHAEDELCFVVLKNIVGKTVINSGNTVMIASGMISRNIGIAEEQEG